MQRSGLEWLWRIKEEPSLWRRYFDDGAALAGLALKGLLPQAGKTRALPGKAEAETIHTPAETVIRLSGQLGQGALRPVREAFRAAAARGRPVRLDLTHVETADCAFLGQVLMLDKHLTRTGSAISLTGVNRRLESLFHANRMNYARAAAEERAAAEASGISQAAL